MRTLIILGAVALCFACDPEEKSIADVGDEPTDVGEEASDADVGEEAGDADVGEEAGDADVGAEDPDGDVGFAEPCPDGPDECAPRDPPPGEGEACNDNQLITRAADPDLGCPDEDLPAGWVGGALFELVVRDNEPVAGPRPDDEDAEGRFCRYRFIGGEAAAEENRDALIGFLGDRIGEVQQDCHVSGGMAALLEDEGIRRALIDTTRQQTDWIPHNTRLPEVTLEGVMLPQRVRVAVVDTAADSAVPGAPGLAEHSPHGRDMGALIQDLACPTCGPMQHPVELSNHAGLDLVGPHQEPDPQGGRFGYQGTVAARIYEAVAVWLADYPDAGDRPRLIINLSIGWEEMYNGVDAEALRVTAVRQAVTFAGCQGALVIAAAGNASGGSPERRGPLYPGAFEAVEADPNCGAGDYRPIVHAVGGVDGLDAPLLKSREASAPRLIGYGFYAAVPQGAQGASGPYTGTSVSTAVASAAAAAAWRYLPDWDAAQIMQLVYESGEPLGRVAEHCLPGDCQDQVRVSVCNATRAALAVVCQDPNTPGCNQPVPNCDPVPATGGANPAFNPAAALTADVALDGTILASPPTSIPGCAHELVTGTVAGADPCPDEQHFGGVVTPWAVFPQPWDDGCDVCSLGSGSLWWSTGSGSGNSLTSPKLNVTSGGSTTSYDLSFGVTTGGLNPGELYLFENLDLPANIDAAEVTFATESAVGASTVSGSDQVILF